ncbi:hypothetical protein EJ08DRAFT_701166 [Tothia fuscella]|uniref:ribonuclease Z n=1 Tax=Tothia fuscella TaxID=1048955 RepID=A0A9P4TTW8_9PEZI|nr:hypothetical protein EJ08DRAFT_701166 [Tothia fuscella]
MATTQYRRMNSFQPSNNQCVDPSEMENWVDFGGLQSPNPNTSSSRVSLSQANSAMTSPSNTMVALDGSDEYQTPVAPSHDYVRFKQQTGLPIGSIDSLRALSQDQMMFSNTGLDDFGFSPNTSMYGGMGSMTGNLGFGADITSPASLPAFFYPNDASANDDFSIDPAAILKEEEAQANVRFYPGMHSEAALRVQHEKDQAMLAHQQKQRAMEQQQRNQNQRKPSHAPMDPHAEETIARVVNQIRQSSNLSGDNESLSPNPSSTLPHIIRSKKEEDEMDEDERLLNSEEGKKLSSKERRQLRNKVSARAFRSRRKEYIGQLEGELSVKTNEANDLKAQNHALMEENARFRALSEKLLSHAAFRPFLEEISRDPELAQSLSTISGSARQSATPTPQPSHKDVDAFSGSQQFMQQQNQHVGMVMMPEPQLDFSQLNLGGNNWALPAGMTNFQSHQVFAVMDVPEPVEPIDVAALSGKTEDTVVESFSEQSKYDYPAEIETPVHSKDEVAFAQSSAETGEESTSTIYQFDESDDAFTLYANNASSAAPLKLEYPVISNGKPHFELVITSDSDTQSSSDRLDSICAQPSKEQEAELRGQRAISKLAALLRGSLKLPSLKLPRSQIKEKIVRPNFTQRIVNWYAHNEDKRITKDLDAFQSSEVYSASVDESEQASRSFHSQILEKPRIYRRINILRAPPLAPPNQGKDYWLNYKPCPSTPLPPQDSKRREIDLMKVWLQFITVPTADTPGTALVLHFDHKRYLIGQIGEGTQRACIENGVSLRKVEEILVTGRCNTTSTGGIVGMFLTLADVIATARASAMTPEAQAKVAADQKARDGKPYVADKTTSSNKSGDLFLTLHGPENLTHSIATARRFVFRKGMPLKVFEARSKEPTRDEHGKWLPDWADGNIRVWVMPIKPAGSDSIPDEVNFNTTLAEDVEREDRYDQLRRGVVNHMFGSRWHMDALVETPLDEVKLPAKLWIRDPQTKNLEAYSGPMPGGAEPLPNPIPTVLVRKPWPAAMVSSLPPTTPKPESVSYIIGGYPRRGKFDAVRAKALGLFRNKEDAHKATLLTQGETVLIASGTTITPDMVLAPDEQSAGIAVVDLPSNDYVEPLINRAEWTSKDVMLGIEGIVWILGPTVAANPALRTFMEKMSHLKHTIASPDHCPNSITMDAAAKSAARLAQVDNEHYLVPHFDNDVLPQSSFRAPENAIQPLPESVGIAKRGMVLNLVPKFGVEENKIIPPLEARSLLPDAEDLMVQEAIELSKSAQASLNKLGAVQELENWNSQIPLQDAEIIALGTGSAIPSRYRNVSGTLVRVPHWGSYLLDAGENTLGQLQRVYPPKDLVEVLKDLRMIWISHLHADHHLGTVPVIKAWHDVVHGPNSPVPPTSPALFKTLNTRREHFGSEERPKYLAVVSDISLLHYLREYSDVENFGYQHILPLAISPSHVKAIEEAQNETTLRLVHSACPVQVIPEIYYPHLLGLRHIAAVAVVHCHGALAVAMTFPRSHNSSAEGAKRAYTHPFKIAYSGDCRPSAPFAHIGENATVLIHEATFEDELVGDAKAKKHSTVREALGVGSLMGAKCVVLTHFSQRYQKVPVLDDYWNHAGDVAKDIVGEDEEQERLPGINDDEIMPVDEGATEIAPVDAPHVKSELIPSTDTEMQGLMPTSNGQGSSFELSVDDTESTMNPDQSSSTTNTVATSVASSQGASSQFEKLLATHVSSSPGSIKVIFAFDYMRVRVGDIAKMECLRPALAKLFEVDIEENEKRAAKRLSNGGDGSGLSKKVRKMIARKG